MDKLERFTQSEMRQRQRLHFHLLKRSNFTMTTFEITLVTFALKQPNFWLNNLTFTFQAQPKVTSPTTCSLNWFSHHVFPFSLNNLVEFIKVADVGLTEEVTEGDYDGLVAVMGHLMAVKDRQASTDEMFEPLKQTIELLKTYGQELPEEVHLQLQVGRPFFQLVLR